MCSRLRLAANLIRINNLQRTYITWESHFFLTLFPTENCRIVDSFQKCPNPCKWSAIFSYVSIDSTAISVFRNTNDRHNVVIHVKICHNSRFAWVHSRCENIQAWNPFFAYHYSCGLYRSKGFFLCFPHSAHQLNTVAALEEIKLRLSNWSAMTEREKHDFHVFSCSLFSNEQWALSTRWNAYNSSRLIFNGDYYKKKLIKIHIFN